MTIISHNNLIPNHKFKQFHEILCVTGGRYLGTPRITPDGVRVDYEFGDYESHIKAWRLCNQDIKEVYSNKVWNKVLRRLRNLLSI